jgi:hypothetical protein
MDSDMQAEKPDPATAAGAQKAPRSAKDSAASMPGASGAAPEKNQDQDRPKENAGSSVPPIPSSALVILPPSMRRFDAKDDTGGKEKPKAGAWARYGSRAALILILCGAAFVAGGRFIGSTPSEHAAGDPATASWQAAKDDSATAQIRQQTMALSDEIHGIEARLDSLSAAAQTPDEIRALKKSVDGLKASFDAQKAQANASIAQLSAKLDQIERVAPKVSQTAFDGTERAEINSAVTERTIDPKAIQTTLDKAARAEKSDSMTTASIPGSSEPQSVEIAPTAQPLAMASAEPQKKQPQVLSDWAVRDVYDGIALVEGPEGAIEVMPGDTIPGAGTVKSIERRSGGWIVLTSRGLVEDERD